jgi:hypothetical protein
VAVLVACALVCLIAPAVVGAEPEPRAIVRVCNFANVPPDTLQRAVSEAARAFEQAGIDLRWSVAQPPTGGDSGRAPEPPRSLPVYQMSLMPESKARMVRLPEHVFGIAQGSQADVFAFRAELQARAWNLPYPVYLGHLMAHEVGHLLLGGNRHSLSGIMSKRLSRTELEQACQGLLQFSPVEGEQMRGGLSQAR